jgi:hypothetical protein
MLAGCWQPGKCGNVRSMAQLWIPTNEMEATASDCAWAVLRLEDGLPFAMDFSKWLPGGSRDAGVERDVLLHPFGANGAEGVSEEGWGILAPPQTRVRVNGDLLRLGIRLLRHRDEIRLPGHAPVYFSTERLAVVQAFAGPEPMVCARCRSEIAREEPTVRCPNPNCGAWHHQGGKPCWTYASACSLCDQATAMETGYRWTPDEIR